MLRKWLKLNKIIELLNIATYKHKRNMKIFIIYNYNIV